MVAIVEIHNVNVNIVLGALPFDTSGVTASSSPVNTVDIGHWITEGAGIINSLLERHGIDPETGLLANGAQLVRRGVIGYAAAQALKSAGITGSKLVEFEKAFDQVDKRIRTDPRSLGDSQDPASVVISSVTTETPKKWSADTFKGW